MSYCSIDGCSKPHKAKGLCSAHYERQRITGSARGAGLERGFRWRSFQRLAQLETNDCIDWPHSTTAAGYGQAATPSGRRFYTHREALILAVGPPPDPSLEAAHSCHNRRCMNHRHLRWATTKENQSDRILDGTSNRGESNLRAKLSSGDVRSIRRLLAEGAQTQVQIAQTFDVSPQLVTDIKKGRRWNHL